MLSGTQLMGELSAEQGILNPQAALRAFELAMLLSIVAAGTVWMIADRLLRIVDAVRAGHVFAEGNAAHLRVVGLSLSTYIFTYIASKSVVQAQVPTAHGVDWLAIAPAIAAALLMFVLAEVFQEGTRMREELEEVI